MTDTSLHAWQIVKPKLRKITAKVYEAIDKYPDHTTAEISKIIHLPINFISGRPGELSKKGLIKRVEKRECAVTKNLAWTWKVK